MKLYKKLALATALVGLAGTASALTIQYDSVVTGATPNTGSAPWLTATITNNGTGVDIVFTTPVDDPEFLTSVFFSLNDTTFDVSDGADNPNIFEEDNCNGKAPANTGPWQLCVSFLSNVKWDTDTDPFSFFVDGLQESAFVFNEAGYLSVAHVQGIEPDCSGWIGDNGAATNRLGETCGTTTVPEPGTLGLLGLGLLGIGYSRRRRAA